MLTWCTALLRKNTHRQQLAQCMLHMVVAAGLLPVPGMSTLQCHLSELVRQRAGSPSLVPGIADLRAVALALTLHGELSSTCLPGTALHNMQRVALCAFQALQVPQLVSRDVSVAAGTARQLRLCQLIAVSISMTW